MSQTAFTHIAIRDWNEAVDDRVAALLVAGSGVTLTYDDGAGSLTIDTAGITDHGALTGLADDDHTQYHNDARGDARYSQLGHSHAFSAITGKPTTLAGYGITDALALSGGTLTGPLTLGASYPIYEDSGSIRVGTSTRSIYGGAFVITRAHTAASNGHGIDENSTIAPSDAGRSYAAFDARGLLTATQNMGHYVGFQFDPVKSGSGSISEFGAFSSSVEVSAGAVGQMRHLQVTDAVVTGTGAITDQYGVLVQGLIAATNNWAIYCLAPTKSYHGGDIAVAGSARTPVASVDIAGTLKAGGATVYQVIVGRPFTGSEGGIYIQSAGSYGEMQAMQEGVGYFPLVLQRRGGNVLIGTTTDDGSTKLQVNGAIKIASSTPASASATGIAGTITWDSSYVYVCTATNTWKRAALSTW